MKTDLEFFLFAGEKSGDWHGSHIISEIERRFPKASISGVGGPLMRQQRFDLILPMEAFEVMGFADVARHLPQMIKQFKQVRQSILGKNPDYLILIDYPGFNLRLAKSLRKHGFQGKIIQYVCPTVWAWGKKRISTLQDHFDYLFTIYPFESQYFENKKLEVVFVGHPSKHTITKYHYKEDWKEKLAIPIDVRLIGIFPGSREGEIRHNLPIQLSAAKCASENNAALKIGVSLAHPKTQEIVLQYAKEMGLTLDQDVFLVPKCYAYELMKDCLVAVATAGTVTLELACHQTPTVVIYALSSLNRWIAKWILKLKLPYFSIVNILLDQEVFLEYIATPPTIENVSNALCHLISDKNNRERIQSQCNQVLEMISLPQSPAEKVLETLIKD